MNDFPLFWGLHAACYAMLEINERMFINSSTRGSTSRSSRHFFQLWSVSLLHLHL